MAKAKTLSGNFTTTGISPPADNVLVSERKFNISISGTFVGTIEVQRSFDDGITWVVVYVYTSAYEGIGFESEQKTQYRFECTALTSGQIDYRLGIGGF